MNNKRPFVTFVRFRFAGADTPAFGAQQGTVGSHRVVGVVAARPGEDQKRTATPFASPGKCADRRLTFASVPTAVSPYT